MATATLPITASKTYAERAHDYCRNVVAGEVLASKWIKLACQRHLDDLKSADSRWYFDADKANKVCRFIESLKLDSGAPFLLQDFQVWLVSSLLGWVDEVGTRKFIEALIMIPKGNGKSPLAAALGLWFGFFDGRPKAEIYCGALSMAQAQEVFTPARNFVDAQRAFTTRLGIQTLKKSIFSGEGSRFVPVVGKGRHGARPYLAILDELHQAITDDLYKTFKSGCNKTTNSLMLTISTAGVASSESPCYQLQIKAQKALDGSLPDERFFAAIYCADESVEWSSTEALRMANPNLGVSNDAEKLKLAIESALRNPGEQNNTKAMHLGIWSTAASAWMNMESWKKCVFDSDLNEERMKGLHCWLGSDLASKLDLSATVRVHREDIDGKSNYFAFCRTYIPEARVNDPANTHYQRWVKQDFLTATAGSAIDYSVIESDTIADIAKYQVQEIDYDPRYADQYSQRVSTESGITRVEVPPSPAVLSPAMKELEAAVADARFHHDGNPVLTWCMSNVLTRETAAGNYTMPEKSRPDNKIDAAVALFIAMSRARLMPTTQTSTWAFAPFTV